MSELSIRLPRNGKLRLDVQIVDTGLPTRLRVYDMDDSEGFIKEVNNIGTSNVQVHWCTPPNNEDRYKIYRIKTEFKESKNDDANWLPHNMRVLEIGPGRSFTVGTDDTISPDNDYDDCVYKVSIVGAEENCD